MADEQQTPRAPTEREPPPVDGILQYLVWLANRGTITIGITINSAGLLVTGILVSDKRYFEGIQQQFVTNAKPEMLAHAKRLFDFVQYLPETPTDVHSPDDLPQFLHLESARIVGTGDNSGLIPSNRGVWWRCRIAAVDGFTPGNIGMILPSDLPDS